MSATTGWYLRECLVGQTLLPVRLDLPVPVKPDRRRLPVLPTSHLSPELRYNKRFCARPAEPPCGAIPMNFKLMSDYEPRGDQPEAIEQLSRGLEAGEKHQVLLGVTGSGKTFTVAKMIERANRPVARARAQQNAGRAALQRIQEFLPAKRRRIFRQLLRLLPAGSLHSRFRHVHRKRIHDQRRTRQAAHERDAVALRAPRRRHRRFGFLHLRHRLAGILLRHARADRKRAEHRARSPAAQAGGHSVRPHARICGGARSACAATASRFIRRTKTTPTPSNSGARKSKPSARSIRSPEPSARAKPICRN